MAAFGLRQYLLKYIACLVTLSNAIVPYNEPFQVVRPAANHKAMLIDKEGLAKLQEGAANDAGIALLSVVGPYHSGKSFLLNSLVMNMKAFIVGRKTTPETMGIWLCRTSLKGSDGSEVWLMDSEGFFGPGVEEGYDAKVFTVASLMGSHLVYNTVKIIDQQAVNLLEILMQQAQLFNSRSRVLASGSVPEFLSADTFPPLTWVVEDFVQELPHAFKQEGPIGHLTTYLEGSSGLQADGSLGARGNETHETIITKTFRDVRVAHLFLPATSKVQLQDLSRMNWNELTEEYRSEVDVLRAHVLRNIKARKIRNKVATGAALAQALSFSIQALQQGMFQELPSLWDSWTAQVAQMALGDADDWFSALLQDVDRGEDPVPISTFNGEVEDRREKATKFYRQLIRDFQVRPQMGELRQRMDRHFHRKLQTYHERTRRWMLELLTQGKESLSKYLSSLELPMDPAELDKSGKGTMERLTSNFSKIVAEFSRPGRKVTLGTLAQMPTFLQEPAIQLSNDFRAQLSARSLENDREVERVFKAAAVAASEAVDSELKTIGETLLGKARMNQIVSSAESACWNAFNDRLGTTKWATAIPKYQIAKVQVRKEALEARVARFSSAHDKRLSAHLHTGLQSAKAAYMEKAGSVSMPAAQTDIDNQHSQLAASTQELLNEYAKTLADTDAFKEINKQLTGFMAEGRQHLQDKNVELWKVYSDGATRCAGAANEQRSRDCYWFCLFNYVPWWHRSISRRNLNVCFAKDAISSRMTPQLQAQVFEVWYSKDMGQAAARVWSKFVALTLTVLVASAATWWFVRGRRAFYSRFYGYYPVQGNVYQSRLGGQGLWAGSDSWVSPGYGLRTDGCYGQQQAVYGQQVGQPHYGPAMTQRRGFFGA